METKSNSPPVSKQDFLFLASLLDGRDSMHRVQKRTPHADALRTAAAAYTERDFVAAYGAFQSACEKVVADMQRLLSRGIDYEVDRLAKEMRKPATAVRGLVEKKRANAQRVIDLFDKLRRDLERKPMVRTFIREREESASATSCSSGVAPSTMLKSASETYIETTPAPPPVEEVLLANRRYEKAAFAPPVPNSIYRVRDKTNVERFIRVAAISSDGARLEVDLLEDGQPPRRKHLPADALARQAALGNCSLLLPMNGAEATAEQAASIQAATDQAVAEREAPKPNAAGREVSDDSAAGESDAANAMLRLDIQNFSRCCADIARANIRFDTQLIKDIGDGPFRAGDYAQAFRHFEQAAVGFNAAASASRRAIADGRRQLQAEKGNLSGKEIQERTAAFVRNEQLVQRAEREFSTILEGLRMYLCGQAD